MRLPSARNNAEQPSRVRRLITRRTLIVASAVSTGTLTAAYPAIGIPVSVTAGVLVALYAITKEG